ncbi:MAG: cadherin-like domain-containing protein [Ardenticatenaceae bacterium]|nr:cadherin-like domain-containing protein [Ardenticatenaceae bacterium]
MTNSLTRRILGTVLFIGTLLFFLASLSWSALSQAQPHVPRPYLVADINPGPDASSPTFLTAGSETLYAFASDPEKRGLWATDGTEENTRFLHEMYPNEPNSSYVPYYPTPVALSGATAAVGDKLFYINDDGVSGEELWISDGSPTGTMMVKDTMPGAASSYPRNLVAFNDSEVIYRTQDEAHGAEIWISDGTITSTQILTDIVPGVGSSDPYGFIRVDNLVYFVADDSTLGDALWQSDGTASGTKLLASIAPWSGSGFINTLTYVNGLLFFYNYHPSFGFEYWRSDGTQAGTWLLKDINSGVGSSMQFDTSNHIGFGGNFYFYANDHSEYGGELWRSDGSQENTILLKDINSGSASSDSMRFAIANSRLFFTANDGVHGRELWVTDGTESGTKLVLDINPTGDGINYYNPYSYHVPDYASLNDLYFFTANDGIHGTELWQSDGTAEGTVMVMDINPGDGSSQPSNFAVIGNTLYFAADDGVHGREIWALSHDAIAEDDTVITRMGQPATILFLENDNYLDPDQLQIAIASQPQHGSVALNNFAFLYTPEMGYIGPDSFTYTLSDGVSAPEAATVIINVEGTRLFLPYIVKFNLVDLPD